MRPQRVDILVLDVGDAESLAVNLGAKPLPRDGRLGGDYGA